MHCGIYVSDNYDALEYPLLFTDNEKANPKFFARTKFPLSQRLMFSNFHEICQLTKTKDEDWRKNRVGSEFNPCPTRFMEDYKCPFDECDPDKCAIHWSLCVQNRISYRYIFV